MKSIKKIGISVLICIFLICTTCICISAESVTENISETVEEVDLGEIKGENLSLSERIEYALQGTVTGMVMVFAVLTLLCLVVALSKVIFYDIPKRARENAKAQEESEQAVEVETNETVALTDANYDTDDDGQLIAVITAAVSAVIESGEYGDEFASGFRVVSFKRTNNGKWNKR